MAHPSSTGRKRAYSAQDARQGQIVLRTPVQRTVFVAGLAGLVVLAIFFALLAWDASDDPAMVIDQAELSPTTTGSAPAPVAN